MYARLLLALCLVLLGAGGGCSGLPSLLSRPPREKVLLVQTSYGAAEKLHNQLRSSDIAEYPMLAATFVNLDDLDSTSVLGLLLSEQIASRLSQFGYSIVELQLRSDELVVRKQDGVLALSREVTELNMDAPAASILIGTYSIVGSQIFVNARVLRSSDGVALASTDFSLPKMRLPTGRCLEVSVGTRLQ